jgi:membrane fusion protein (multidrug efflux system)
LDNAQAALGRAEANLPALRSRADRLREALSSKAVSQQAFDDADAALKQATADAQYWKTMVETARIHLGYARIASPISGRIGKSAVTDGAIVTAYQPVPLATIQQLDPIYVDVPQSIAEVRRWRTAWGPLSQGGTNLNSVQLILGDGTRYPQEGVLQFRDVSVDPTTGSVTLRMVFPNPDGVLLPGMFVRAVVKEGVNEAAIFIPQSAVTRDPKGNPLALVVDASGKAEQRPLKLDRAMGDQWLVASGLAPGDSVIVEGALKVRPGAAVKAVPFQGGSAAGAGGGTPPPGPPTK